MAHARLPLILLFAVAGVLAPLCPAQTDSNGEDSLPQPDPQLAERLAAPRATMTTFLASVNENRLANAADCLDLSELSLSRDAQLAKGKTYAYDLKEIIDRTVWIDLDAIPDDPDYGQPYRLSEQAGMDPGVVRDARRIAIARGEDGLWRFSADTVAAVDELLGRALAREKVAGQESQARRPFAIWLRDQFPQNFRQSHFLIPDYQWISLLVLILLGFVADLLARLLLYHLTNAWLKYFRDDAEQQTDRGVWRPVGLFVQAVVWYTGTYFIGLPAFALVVLLAALKLFAVVAGVWTGFRLIDLLAGYLTRKATGTDTKFDDLLVPLVSKSLKVFLVCIGLLTCAQAFNLPIAGLIGGLGIGGAAIAFASKDAIANLFGSVTVLTDRPFEIGDWIVTEGIEGTVETVGFRSTRIRTFYGSIITLPNSRLTTAAVDNMGRRKYRRIKATIGVQYDTTPEQMDAFCEGIREIFRRHPYTRKDYYHVYFNAFSDSSLDILLYGFLDCPDWAIELREKHRLFLDIVRLAKKLGVSFAFPTRTLHMFQEEAGTNGGAADLVEPATVGKKLGAEIAGPLLVGDERPGAVSFTGPSDVD